MKKVLLTYLSNGKLLFRLSIAYNLKFFCLIASCKELLLYRTVSVGDYDNCNIFLLPDVIPDANSQALHKEEDIL